MNATHPILAFDLSQRPPRSPRCRLGGYAILPRTLDKCRAFIVGKQGEYHFNCPLDQEVFRFTGIDAAQFKEELSHGRSDSEMLAWIHANASNKHAWWEIEAWSAYQERRAPDSDAETLNFFASTLAKLSRTRSDIQSWADLLDLDDHCSFGGTA